MRRLQSAGALLATLALAGCLGSRPQIPSGAKVDIPQTFRFQAGEAAVDAH